MQHIRGQVQAYWFLTSLYETVMCMLNKHHKDYIRARKHMYLYLYIAKV